ncbi:MAG: hypothetical protein U0U67_06040 [Chitinophagales bacterium]
MRKLLLFFLVLSAVGLYAQESTPYSRYGLGYLVDNNHMQSAQMGGLGAAFQSAESPNYINPASYASMQLTTFDGGISGNFERIKTTDTKSKQNSFTLNYLSIFFPANKYWTTGASLLPFSSKDYLISQTQVFDTTSSMKFEYEGSGTLYNFSWGNGFKYKGFQVGVNLGYLFGKLNNNTFGYALNKDGSIDQTAFTTWSFTNAKVSSFIWNAGAQYVLDIKSKKDTTKLYNVVFGVSGSAPIKFSKRTYIDDALYNFESKYLTTRGNTVGLNDFITDYIKPQSEYTKILDTLSEKFGQAANIKIPATLNVGVMAFQGIKWKAGVDFRYQPWSKYTGYEGGAASKLSNSWRVAFGGEFLPNDKNFKKFFSKLKYRAGFSYTRTNIAINNTAINEFGMNFGVGIPIVITVTSPEGLINKLYVYAFNVGIEGGSRGTTQKNLVQETFVKLKIGISLNDRWFVKRKYY